MTDLLYYAQPHYAVLETLHHGVEIRRYAPRVAAEASLVGAGRVRMQLFLPSRYSAETAPRPVDPRIRILSLPEERLAVLRLSGRASVDNEVAVRLAPR